jgi:hypothetical protein
MSTADVSPVVSGLRKLFGEALEAGSGRGLKHLEAHPVLFDVLKRVVLFDHISICEVAVECRLGPRQILALELYHDVDPRLRGKAGRRGTGRFVGPGRKYVERKALQNSRFLLA